MASKPTCVAIRSVSATASPGANISSTANAITAKSSTCRRSARACANTATTSRRRIRIFSAGLPNIATSFPDWILKLPPELSDEEATPLNCGVATMASVTEAAEIALGDAVVIQGLGLLGLYGAAMAKARGARCVIGLDAVASRLAVAKRFGADHVIDVSRASARSIVDRVRALCPPDGADAVIEVCGIPDVIPQGLQMLRVGGCYVLGGLVNPEANVTIDANVLVKRWITMRGIHNYHPRHLIRALDFVMANRERFPFKDIVDAKFALKDLDAAFKKASERSVLRAAIVP
jgi:threonine dehydrogenase-like Zn-dependent dehydrogenase